MALVFATIATFVPLVVGAAEVALSNMLVGQAGHEPFKLPHDRTDLYDQLQIEFGFDVGRAGVRFETDQNSENTFPYRAITQRWAEWNEPRVRARIGNFYTIRDLFSKGHKPSSLRYALCSVP